MEFSDFYTKSIAQAIENLKMFNNHKKVVYLTFGHFEGGDIKRTNTKGLVRGMTENFFFFDIYGEKTTKKIKFSGEIKLEDSFFFPRGVKKEDYPLLFKRQKTSPFKRKEKVGHEPLFSLKAWTSELQEEFLGSMRRPTIVVGLPNGDLQYLSGVVCPPTGAGILTLYRKSSLTILRKPIEGIDSFGTRTLIHIRDVSSEEIKIDIPETSIVGWFER